MTYKVISISLSIIKLCHYLYIVRSKDCPKCDKYKLLIIHTFSGGGLAYSRSGIVIEAISNGSIFKWQMVLASHINTATELQTPQQYHRLTSDKYSEVGQMAGRVPTNQSTGAPSTSLPREIVSATWLLQFVKILMLWSHFSWLPWSNTMDCTADICTGKGSLTVSCKGGK